MDFLSALIIWVSALGLVFLLSEYFFRRRVLQIPKDTVFGGAYNRRDSLIAEVKDPALWKIPWREYATNIDLKRSSGGREYQVHINAYGFRGEDIASPKKEGVFRILCIGDSTTVEGDSDDRTYPALLEKELRVHYGRERVEVINAGISGLDSSNIRQTLARYFICEPDLIIYQSFVNDIMRFVLGRWRQQYPFLSVIGKRSVFLSILCNYLIFFSDRQLCGIFRDVTLSNEYCIWQECVTRRVPIFFSEALAPAVDTCSTDCIAFLDWYIQKSWGKVFTYRNYDRCVRMYNASLKRHCLDNKIPCIALAEEMRGAADLFWDICHLTEEGLRQKAGCIARFVSKNCLEGRVLKQ